MISGHIFGSELQIKQGSYSLMKVNLRTFNDFQASMYKKLRNKRMKGVRNAI